MAQGLSYDDVLLRPNYSEIESRSECDTSTYITEGIKLNIPIIAANMNTVCEKEMAIKMSLLGGVGVIHRYMTVADQAAQIKAVKKYTTSFRTDFYSLDKDATLGAYFELVERSGVKSFPVMSDMKLIGIVTRRDTWGKEDMSTPITDLMTHWVDLETIANKDFSEPEALARMIERKVEQLPVTAGDSEVVIGIVSRKDLNHLKYKYPKKTTDSKNRLIVGAAVGVKLDPESILPIIKEQPDFLVVDIAHGHHSLMDKTLVDLKDAYPDMPVIVGNVGTIEAVERYKKKADGIKILVGPGAACRTRIVTGFGTPEFSTIRECTSPARSLNLVSSQGYPYIIADGGITNSGDIVKAIFAGASSVMIGGLLAGTSDSPGKVLNMDGKSVKQFKGMASHEAYLEKNMALGETVEAFHFEAEGASGYVPYRGETDHFVNSLIQGFKSGMSYAGARTMAELREYGKNPENYYVVSPMGFSRNGSHNMTVK